MTAGFAIPMSPQIAEQIALAAVAKALADPGNDLSVQIAAAEYRNKPTIHPITGEWVTRPAKITVNAAGHIVAETLGEVE